MKKINLYKYQGDNGCIVSPLKLPMEHTSMFRLVADEGKELINGDRRLKVVDVQDIAGWEEVDMEVEDGGQDTLEI